MYPSISGKFHKKDLNLCDCGVNTLFLLNVFYSFFRCNELMCLRQTRQETGAYSGSGGDSHSD